MKTIDPHLEETRMGRLLADGLRELAATTPCLTDDQLESLADGSMPEPERELALSHIAGCDVCRHGFVVATRLLAAEQEINAEQNKVRHISTARKYSVPLALAASLLLSFGLYHSMKNSGETAPPGVTPPPGQIARVEAPQTPPAAQQGSSPQKPKENHHQQMLALAAKLGGAAKGKSSDIEFVPASQAGFASGGVEEANRFHTGFAAFALVASCDSGDVSAVQRAAASLDERMKRLALTEEDRGNLLARAQKKVAETPTPEACRDLFAASTNVIEKRYYEDPYLNLGYWMAALRISAQQKQPDILLHPQFRDTILKAAKFEAPRGVAKRCADIAAIAAGTMDDAAWKRLEELADDIQKRF